MQVLPFCSIEEAKANALALCRALEFYAVCIPGPEGGAPIDVGLQRTQGLMAKALGYVRWEDLVSSLAAGAQVMYLDMGADRDAAHRALATSFARCLGTADVVDNIERAMSLSAFGCTLKMRKEACRQLDSFPCKTVDQWQRLVTLQAGSAYVSRYNRGRSAYEIDILEWEYKKNVAEVLGTKPPRKPRKHKVS